MAKQKPLAKQAVQYEDLLQGYFGAGGGGGLIGAATKGIAAKATQKAYKKHYGIDSLSKDDHQDNLRQFLLAFGKAGRALLKVNPDTLDKIDVSLLGQQTGMAVEVITEEKKGLLGTSTTHIISATAGAGIPLATPPVGTPQAQPGQMPPMPPQPAAAPPPPAAPPPTAAATPPPVAAAPRPAPRPPGPAPQPGAMPPMPGPGPAASAPPAAAEEQSRMGRLKGMNPLKKVQDALESKVFDKVVKQAIELIKKHGFEKAADYLVSFAVQLLEEHAGAVIPKKLQSKSKKIVEKAAKNVVGKAMVKAKELIDQGKDADVDGALAADPNPLATPPAGMPAIATPPVGTPVAASPMGPPPTPRAPTPPPMPAPPPGVMPPPRTAAPLVNPGDLNTQTLKSLYEAAAMPTNVSPQGHLTVGDGHTAYVFPVLDGNFIQLTIVASARPDSSRESRLSFANRVNEQLTNVRARVADAGQISFDAFVPVGGGTSRDAIVRATKHFLATVTQAGGLDTERVIAG